jgi:hypothetical protein
LLTRAEKKNFQTLEKVFGDGAQGLLECELAVDIPAGTRVAVVTAIVFDGSEYHMTPFALMVPGNPYETLKPGKER